MIIINIYLVLYDFKICFYFSTFVYLTNCSGNSKNDELSDQNEFSSPEIQFTQAMLMFDNQQYELATDKFKNIDYVYYMKALCFYEQISHEGLDGKLNELALENLNQVIQRFPDSKYAKDSLQKKILVKSNIAAKHMYIARFYQKDKKYTAALNRYKVVIDSFQETKFAPEALYRVSEIYLSIGMKKEAEKNAVILGYNYPESTWYKLIYGDLTNQNNETIFSKSIGKIFN